MITRDVSVFGSKIIEEHGAISVILRVDTVTWTSNL